MQALEIVDWRRRVFALYAEVRAASDLAAAHDLWRRGRDELFAQHPASPLLDEDRPDFTGLRVLPYDPEWRFTCRIEPTEPHRMEVETGTDGIVPFDRLGRVDVPGAAHLPSMEDPPGFLGLVLGWVAEHD